MHPVKSSGAGRGRAAVLCQQGDGADHSHIREHSGAAGLAVCGRGPVHISTRRSTLAQDLSCKWAQVSGEEVRAHRSLQSLPGPYLGSWASRFVFHRFD